VAATACTQLAARSPYDPASRSQWRCLLSPLPKITSVSTSAHIRYELQRGLTLPPVTLGAVSSSFIISNSVRVDSFPAHPPTGVASACSRNLSFPLVESILPLLTRLGALSVVILGSSSVPFLPYSSAPIATGAPQSRFRRAFEYLSLYAQIAPLLFPCPPLRQRSAHFSP
jgi:hypothetical protein